jgi:5-methylcytosine-specific restriction endonuclease McrA
LAIAAHESPALVLNADYRPLSYYPLSLCPWQEAVKAVLLERVQIVCEYEKTIRSTRFLMRLPSVICLKDYTRPADKKPPFTRFNVFLRDHFSCQYCGLHLPIVELTFDHLIPRSRGGQTSWQNIVTACNACNVRKGSRLPHEANMQPRLAPQIPSLQMLQKHGRRYPPNYLHQSWRDFLYWDSELESS